MKRKERCLSEEAHFDEVGVCELDDENANDAAPDHRRPRPAPDGKQEKHGEDTQGQEIKC